ncbi:uncharacterized protein JCM6883_001424 [Sporobolomyces salmoneus]|uniref:uncharacterized protein n=1 Tax=Sporobolomyces salmoneus TaxID=183962 RepID=UPI00317C8187
MVSTRSNRIPMTSLTALTLHSNRKTTSRRHPPVPQLTCEGKLCRQYQPSIVQCVKVGDDGVGGLEWKCEAELPKGIRFGKLEVGCEGWDGPDDPFVLKASCGLTYRLVPASRSLEEDSGSYRSSFSKSQLSFSDLLFYLLFAFALFTLLRSFLISLFPNLRRFSTPRRPFSNFWPGGGGGGPGGGGGGPGGGGGGPGGGGGGGGGGGPPPPYTPKPTDTTRERTNEGWRPGFWSGIVAGAAANHLLRPSQPGRTWGNGAVGGYGTRDRSNWGFGGGGAGGMNLRDNDDDWDRGVGGSGLSRSTGFGGTRNR